MASNRTRHRLGLIARLALLIVATGTLISPTALAQATKATDKADSVFDDDKKTAGTDKNAPATKGATLSDRDTIGFSQQNTAAQMNELEERMFRLSEALRGLEPENASRLRLALQFSREEQILEQMRETHKFLKDAQLSKAETEVKELIAKLEHLRNLLLAEDLDFQLKLARLRQMRETLGQLDRIVTEEKRELGWSRFALEQRASVSSGPPPANPTCRRSSATRKPWLPTPRSHQRRERTRPKTPGRRSGSVSGNFAARRPGLQPIHYSQTFSPPTCAAPTPIWPTP